MKRLLALTAALAAFAAFAIPALAATKSVGIGDSSFKPSHVTVKAGTKVVWKWQSSLPHNVTVTSGPKKFHSKTQSSGTYAAIPHKKGTYSIVCTVHGFTMKLVVR